MPFAAFNDYLRQSVTLRRIAEVIDFVTYREVRELDFARADVPPKVEPATRKS